MLYSVLIHFLLKGSYLNSKKTCGYRLSNVKARHLSPSPIHPIPQQSLKTEDDNPSGKEREALTDGKVSTLLCFFIYTKLREPFKHYILSVCKAGFNLFDYRFKNSLGPCPRKTAFMVYAVYDVFFCEDHSGDLRYSILIALYDDIL